MVDFWTASIKDPSGRLESVDFEVVWSTLWVGIQVPSRPEIERDRFRSDYVTNSSQIDSTLIMGKWLETVVRGTCCTLDSWDEISNPYILFPRSGKSRVRYGSDQTQ